MESHGSVTFHLSVNTPPVKVPSKRSVRRDPVGLFAPEKVTTTAADCPGNNLPRFCGNGVAFVVGDVSVPSVKVTLLATAPPMF